MNADGAHRSDKWLRRLLADIVLGKDDVAICVEAVLKEMPGAEASYVANAIDQNPLVKSAIDRLVVKMSVALALMKTLEKQHDVDSIVRLLQEVEEFERIDVLVKFGMAMVKADQRLFQGGVAGDVSVLLPLPESVIQSRYAQVLEALDSIGQPRH